MAYDVADDFEHSYGIGIDPEKALRANQMFARWMEAVHEEMPGALHVNSEDLDIIMLGTAALLGEFAGLIWASHGKEAAGKGLLHKCEVAASKMAAVATQAAATPAGPAFP